VIAYGGYVCLPPGSYTARFRFRQGPSQATGPGAGELLVVNPATGTPFAKAPIAPLPHKSNVVQEVTFHLTEPLTVEPRVTGGDAELWLESATFLDLPRLD